MLVHVEVLVDLVTRCDGEHDQSVAVRVTVVAFTILEDTRGVGKSSLTLEHALQVIVGLCEVVADVAARIESIGREERCLGESEECR